jgi:uncharacterized protein (DUF58 family)
VGGWLRGWQKAGQKAWARLVEASQPLRDLVAPVTSLIRPAGWLAIAAAIVSAIVGALLGWQEFLVLAMLLVALLLVAVVYILGRATYAVNVDMARLRVRVGADAYGGLVIANTATRPVLASLVIMPVGKSTIVMRVPRLVANQSFNETFRIDTSQRAVVPIGPVKSTRGDGLGLLRRDIGWTEKKEMFIHPRTVSLAGSSAGLRRDLEGRPSDTLSSSDIAFHALRDYVVGDDLRHIHWKSSARLGKLLVRQFEETRRSHLVVCLALAADDYRDEADCELAISAAASLGEQSIKDERDVSIQVPGRRLEVATRARMLDDFSRLVFAKTGAGIESVALEASESTPEASVAVIIAGTAASPARLHAAAARFPVDVFTIILRTEVGAKLSRSALGNSRVLTIGDLADLPRGLRSVEV